jgi:hypothetical protein
MLGLRGHGPAAVVVATLDRDEVLTLLAPVFQREQPRLQVGLGVGSPTATTAGDSPVIHHDPSVRRVGWPEVDQPGRGRYGPDGHALGVGPSCQLAGRLLRALLLCVSLRARLQASEELRTRRFHFLENGQHLRAECHSA